MVPRSVLRVGVAIAAIPLLAACGGGGTTGERDFCTQYAELVKASDKMNPRTR